MKKGKSIKGTSLENFHPERIYVLERYFSHPVTKRVLELYGRESEVIYTRTQLVSEKGDCLGETVSRGKHIVFLGETAGFISEQDAQAGEYCPGFTKLIPISNGCFFSCMYCFLQSTYRGIFPYIKMNLNHEDMVRQLKRDIPKRRDRPHVYHMGENLDSLSFDYIYPLTDILVPFFAERDARLLLLTKSDCVDNLVKLDHKGHTTVSWSLNSDYATKKIEINTAPLGRRIKAARRVQEAGYPLRLRFDPLLPIGDWRKRYSGMMDRVFRELKPERVTIGSLRFFPTLRSISEERFGETGVFDDRFLGTDQDSDSRIRYNQETRRELYRFVADGIRERAGYDIEIGLCKETAEMWEAAGLKLNKKHTTCHCIL